MIGKLIGIYKGYYGNTAIIDIARCNDGAIGYEVQMKTNDISLLTYGEKCELFIKEIVKEDDDLLYGFLSFEDKCWFEEFIKLSGLGPKIALSILSAFSCNTIAEAIMMNDCDFFSSISGIGGKLANRIPNEMRKTIDKINEKIANFGGAVSNKIAGRDRQGGIYKQPMTANIGQTTKKQKQKTLLDNDVKSSRQSKTTIINDAVNALVVLGFERNKLYNEVFKIVKNNEGISTEDIIKEFLKKIK